MRYFVNCFLRSVLTYCTDFCPNQSPRQELLESRSQPVLDEVDLALPVVDEVRLAVVEELQEEPREVVEDLEVAEALVVAEVVAVVEEAVDLVLQEAEEEAEVDSEDEDRCVHMFTLQDCVTKHLEWRSRKYPDGTRAGKLSHYHARCYTKTTINSVSL